MGIASGTRLGPYEIVAPLGAGGMGEVYRARDARLGREVAIKLLPASFSADADRLRRFEQEARAAGILNHPNITAVYDIGSYQNAPYVVQELLEGETLRSALAGGRLSPKKAVECALQIAHGLGAAHEKGIVHRDLKPENLFVTGDGRVKILDFGLAKLTQAEEKGGALSDLATAAAGTQAGVVLGTLGYMSPEQLKGQPADSRSDIFSFGAVFYEMLAGRRAFQKDTSAETITAILNEDPPEVQESGARISPALDRVVRHCLEKSSASRFQSARDLAFALDSLSTSSDPAGATASVGRATGRRSRAGERLAFVAAGALLAGVALLFLMPGRGRVAAPAPAVRFTIPPPGSATLQGMVALSPDGKRLAFVAATQESGALIWVRALDSLEARRLDGTQGAAFPFWSPDGRWLAFFAQGKLKKIEASGGTPQTLCDAPVPRGGSWSANGTILFAANAGGEIDRVPEAGGRPAALAHLVSRKAELYRWPSFLPDGLHFLYFELTGDLRERGIHLGSLDSADTSRLVAAEGGAAYAAPGHLLFRVGDRLMSQPFDANRLRVTSDASPVVEDVWWDSLTTLATAFSVSANGVLAYQTGGMASTSLLWYDRSGRQLGTAGPPGAYIEPTLSPDGRWLALTRGEPDSLRVNIWLIDLERGSLSRATSEEVLYAATPLWSPDGRSIVYGVYPTGGAYLKNPHAVEGGKLLFETPSYTPLDDWSRDGRFLIYEMIDWKTFHGNLGLRDLTTSQSRPILETKSNESGARLSPNGRWLAYFSDESGSEEVFIRSFPASIDRWQVSAGGGAQPRWRGDGKELFYVSPDGKIMSVEIRTEPKFLAQAPRALFSTRILPLIEARNNYDVTPDGQRFIVNSRRPEDAFLPITVVVNWRREVPK